MRTNSFEEKPASVQVSLPWDKITARAFALAILVNALILLLAAWLNIGKPERTFRQTQSIPIELLEFGFGEKQGKSGGNLAAEGHKAKGKPIQNPLEDAQKIPTPASKQETTKTPVETNTGEIPKAVKNIPVEADAPTVADASGTKSKGEADGDADGEGLGLFGGGKGKGAGYGIEWGSGGNRVVLEKVLPTYPPNVRLSAQIKIRFTVLPNGTVGVMRPVQKGDPALERAAMEALRKWRFNPLTSEKMMEGIITFTFVIK